MSGPSLNAHEAAELVEHALAAALAGADAALLGYRRRPDVVFKGQHDLVTEHDVASERAVRAALTALTPNIPVVGEEEGGGEAMRGRRWLVDPIDGTTNFAHGHPMWAVSVGLLEDGHPLCGAVVAPALGVRWAGSIRGDVRRWEARTGWEPCRVSSTEALEHALVATGFPTDRRTAPRNNLESFQRVKPHVRAIRRCGSAALDLSFVADGTYDGYWERPLHAWDAAAGAALVLGAGGTLTALDGGPVLLDRGHFLASNGRVHAALLALIGG